MALLSAEKKLTFDEYYSKPSVAVPGNHQMQQVRFQKSSLQVQTEILEGLVAEGITGYAKNRGVKLIILSSHGSHSPEDSSHSGSFSFQTLPHWRTAHTCSGGAVSRSVGTVCNDINYSLPIVNNAF
jgi:hypothetical protein